MSTTAWRPDWWKNEHLSAWERIKEALHRDWDQTKKDMHMGGHEMNQGAADTVKQMAGKEPLPPSDQANPPHVIGSWSDAELPVGYGYGARHQYGAKHPTWSEDLDNTLRSEWERNPDTSRPAWRDVKDQVRYGYEYKPRS